MPAPAPANNNYSGVIDAITTQQFMRGEFDNTKKRNVLLRELDARGNIKGEAGGKFMERTARVGQFQSQVRGDLVERVFSRKAQRVTYALPWSWSEVTGAIGEQDLAINNSEQGLVKLNSVMMKNMAQDFTKDITTNLLRQNAGTNATFGQAVVAGSPVPLFGLPTMFGYGASALAYNPDTQVVGGAVAATDREVTPNVSYCGISTHPTNAIAGIDNKTNEATSPVLVNWSSTAFGTGGATWRLNATAALDQLINRLARSPDPMDNPDLLMMTRTMFTDFSQSVMAGGPSGLGGRVVFTEQSQNPNYRVFKDNMIPYGNCKGYWDVGMPANVAYALNSNYLEFEYFKIKSIEQQADLSTDTGEGTEMFTVRTDYDIKQGGNLAVAALMANIWGNPFYHGAAYNFA